MYKNKLSPFTYASECFISCSFYLNPAKERYTDKKAYYTGKATFTKKINNLQTYQI